MAQNNTELKKRRKNKKNFQDYFDELCSKQHLLLFYLFIN